MTGLQLKAAIELQGWQSVTGCTDSAAATLQPKIGF